MPESEYVTKAQFAQDISALDSIIRADNRRLRDDVVGFRQEFTVFRGEVMGFRQEFVTLRDDVAGFRREFVAFRDDVNAFRVQVIDQIGALTSRMDKLEMRVEHLDQKMDRNFALLFAHLGIHH